MMADLLCSLKALNIPIDESTPDEFVHVYDKNNEEFSHEILDDVIEVWKVYKQQMIMKMKMYTLWSNLVHIVQHQQETCHFCGFEHIYKKVFKVEDQLLCPDVQAQAGNYYNELTNSFELFQQ